MKKSIVVLLSAILAISFSGCKQIVNDSVGVNKNNAGVSENNASNLALASTGISVTPDFPAVRLISGSEKNIINVKKYGAVGDGKNDDTKAVISAIKAAEKKSGILYFPAGSYIVGDVTVPENIACGINGEIFIKSGCTFTVESKEIYFPKNKIFDGDGNVGLFTGIGYCYPEWFGASTYSSDNSSAFQKAVNCAEVVYVSRGKYIFKNSVILPQDSEVTIVGMGAESTNFNLDGNSDLIAFKYDYSSGKPSKFNFKFLYFSSNINDYPYDKNVEDYPSLLSYNGTQEHQDGSVNLQTVR